MSLKQQKSRDTAGVSPEYDPTEAIAQWRNRPYVWPIVGGVKAPQGECSSCRLKDKRHPDGRACDFSCVGV